MSAQKSEIVILGGGFGGVATAKKILRRLNSPYKLTVIDRKDFHDYHGQLYDVASAWIPKKNPKKIDYSEIEGTVALPLTQIFPDNTVDFIFDEVTGIDSKNNKVLFAKKVAVSFDYLVIALGSETNYFGINGLEEKSLGFKNVEEALNIRNQIVEAFYNYKKGSEINIVIGGGGFSGCELAAELTSFVEKLCQEHGIPKEKVILTIVEACPTLLQGAKKWSQEEALKRLEALGVKVLVNSSIESVGNSKVKIKDGPELEYTILIWTAGIKANSLMSKFTDMELGKGGCLMTDDYLRVKGFENIYTIGDNAYCFDSKHNCPVAPTAQKAAHEGLSAAINICHQIKNEPLQKHVPELPTFSIPLGSKFALTTFGNLHLDSYPGWIARELITLNYFTKILPFLEALSFWWNGIKIFTRNDDV